nr:SHOCT domain-containing protein [Dehalococcoides mccartyi]
MMNTQKQQLVHCTLDEKKPVPQEQLQREVDYVRAQRILDSMLQNGLISLSEFNKITALNRQSFSPALAQIMPENR